MLHRSLILPLLIHLKTQLSIAQIARLVWLPCWAALLLCPLTGHSQKIPSACGAGSSPATACDDACIFCNFNGYTGSTFGFPSGTATAFCGTVENAQWLGFIAGKDKATFIIKPFNCLGGNGVQVALYNDCKLKPLACDKGVEFGGTKPVSISVDLSPGSNYFLLIDGYAGDQCEFTVEVSPKEAVYEPPLGMVAEISGPTKLCPGATAQFSVQPVDGASAYIWTGPPGSMLDTVPLPVTAGRSVNLTIGSTAGSICVQAANSCSVNPPCSSSLAIELLPDAARPVIDMDTLDHLNCTNTPVKLNPRISPAGNYVVAWTADSTGHLIGSLNNPLILTDQPGTYNLLVTNELNGCTSSVDVRVGPPDIPSSADLEVKNITCYGDNNGFLGIHGVTGGKEPFVFSLDGAPYTLTHEHRYLTPGEHTLALEGADGCAWDTTFSVTQPEELLVNLGADTSIHLGHPVQLWVGAAVNYPDRVAQRTAEPPDMTSMLCDTCRYFPNRSFRYQVTVVDSNGCRATDDRIIVVSTERFVFVPNAFAPEAQEERNTRLTVFGGEDVERVVSFQIFNRWGKTVYEHYNFPPNDDAAAWDGSVSGEKAPPAVFAWRAEVLFKDGATEQFTGDVTVVR